MLPGLQIKQPIPVFVSRDDALPPGGIADFQAFRLGKRHLSVQQQPPGGDAPLIQILPYLQLQPIEPARLHPELPCEPLSRIFPRAASDFIQPPHRRIVGIGRGRAAVIGGIQRGIGFFKGRLSLHRDRLYPGDGALCPVVGRDLSIGGKLLRRPQRDRPDIHTLPHGRKRQGIGSLTKPEQERLGHIALTVPQLRGLPAVFLHL